jgi:branched-chain amino acid transport system permease protein
MAEFCGDIKSNYIQDQAIFNTKIIRFFMIILVTSFGLSGFFLSKFSLHLLITIGIAIIGAIGINIISGFTGLISLGHGAFIGVGAYTAAILGDKMGIPFIISLFLSGLFTSCTGIIFGLPSLRIKGLYLLMATMAAQVIINFLMINWRSLTKGVYGYAVAPASICGLVFDTEVKFYYLVFILVLVFVFLATNIMRSRYGRAFVAIRDQDIAADLIGINLFKYKAIAFAIGSFYAGISGALTAHYLRVISPEHFPFWLSIEYLTMIIVGGLGSIMGSIYGAVFITLLPEWLRILLENYMVKLIPSAKDAFPQFREILFGIIIISFLIFEPHGLAEIHRRIKKYFKLWPFRY